MMSTTIASSACSPSDSQQSPTTSGGSGGSGSPAGGGTGGTSGGTAGSGGAGGSSGSGGSSSGGVGGAMSIDGGNAGASGGGGGLTTLEAACRATIFMQCDRRYTCDGNATNYAACRNYADLCPDYYFSDGSNRTLESVAQCVDQIKQLTCTDLDMSILPSCISGGKRQTGEGCLFHSQCESVLCSGGPTDCGQCLRASATGSACGDSSSSCRDTDFCQRGTCAPVATVIHGGAGAACDVTAKPLRGCSGDLICAGSSSGSGTGTCQPQATEGQPCLLNAFKTTATPNVCAKGLACNTTSLTCEKPVVCGTTKCDAQSYCDDAASGRCAPRIAKGKPCDSAKLACELDSQCSMVSDGSTMCYATRAGLGEPCSSGRTCAYAFKCIDGKCGTPAAKSCGGGADAGH